ncbi:GNAT family N-acetyltransferase [Ornithinimicrobium sp. F0845]|uniref:GNAT family N-acetyltransferase n=1 Tax=Ornithinimicrobium sp. F0845 TaxID=2926412 RepID=UPI001FF34043|nr:GNAT family N-acetyltransferase [Ornithinimicrobium sp. F0845]MCK0113168.1 GNAT family N-acetyltransferase [Ornithinimicrobium sp. F0845]
MTTWSHLRPEDVPAWAELTNLLARVDQTEEFYEAEDLAEELTEHGFTPELDSWALWEGDRLIGYGQLRCRATHDGRVKAYLGGGIHPDVRRRGLGTELMDRMEPRGRELAAQVAPGAPVTWSVSGGVEGASVRPMLEHRGYAIVRYWNEMRRVLDGSPVEVPEVDAVLVSPTDEHREATRLAHNEAFRDHWGSGPQSPEDWADTWGARSNRMAASTVALDPQGRVLAYVLAGTWVPEELYVSRVGTVPAARGRGLAHAALLRTVSLAEGFDYVALDVDSASPTGATRLYERAGFSLSKVTCLYHRDAPAP